MVFHWVLTTKINKKQLISYSTHFERQQSLNDEKRR